jgi:hypothetical protein
MTTDVRTLLHDAADTPTRDPDITRALATAHARRRRARGLGALAAVIVIALGVGAIALGSGGDDGARVAIGPRQTGSTIPDDWQTITTDAGVSIAVPPGWTSEPPSTTPIGTPLVNVSDLADDAGDVLASCTMEAHRDPAVLPSSPGSLISVWEFPGDSTQVPDVANATLDVVDRPDTFTGALVPGPNECKGARYDQLAFRDAGRVFLVRVVSVFPTAEDEQARLRLAAQVLDTLRVEPFGGSTTTVPSTTTTPAAASVPLPTITTLPAFVPSTDDERAIQELFEAWLRDHPDDDTRRIVEDADALLGAIHQGLAQHTPQDLALYSGTVSAIRMLDADHAEVQYTLLHGGQPQFGLRTGIAVRIDGRWMVSRATECALLSLGGITCPPPS